MRYLITGEWNRHRVMRLIMVFFSFYVAGFWLTSALLYFLHMDLTPLSVIRYYRGDEAMFMPPQSYQSLLELTHVHLFAMGVLLVTLTHLLLFVPGSDRRKAALAVAVLASGFIESTSGWLVRYVHPLFSLLKIGSFLSLQLSTALVLVFIIKALRTKNRLSYQDEPTQAVAEARRAKQRARDGNEEEGGRIVGGIVALFLAAGTSCFAQAETLPTSESAVSPSSAQQPAIRVQSRPAMGTILSVSLCASGGEETRRYFDQIFKAVENIEEKISEWRPTSEISRVIRHAGKSEEAVSPVTERFLRLSLQMWQQTDGAFDITYRTPRQPLPLNTKQTSRPTPIQLSPGHAFLREKGAIIDTGGIGKGFALDELTPLVKQLGISCALFDFGGSSFLAIGTPPHEEGWRLIGESAHQAPILLRDRAASTSASLMMTDGPLPPHPHIIDPRTNTPVNTQRHMTVLCTSAGVADAFSTFAVVVGSSMARRIIKSADCELISHQ